MLTLGVLAVDGVEQALRLVAEAERRPDIGHGGRLDLALRPAGALSKTREEPDVDSHRSLCSTISLVNEFELSELTVALRGPVA
jgi:hypothetical protein